jgi:hypothetical protein
MERFWWIWTSVASLTYWRTEAWTLFMHGLNNILVLPSSPGTDPVLTPRPRLSVRPRHNRLQIASICS